MQLVRPSEAHLTSYAAALARGGSPDNLRGPAATAEELDRIAADPAGFLAALDDRDAKGPPMHLPDGSIAARLPAFHRWMWDGEFARSIGFCWRPGTTDLPPYCLGHIGYGVVAWKQRRGYATRALALMLPVAKQEGLPFVESTTDVDNVASERVILANGAILAEEFITPPVFESTPGLRYRIHFN
jgi:predicted acetyltransferase